MKILFVFAHPDDESYGPAGTIAKLSAEHEVHVLSLCCGNRPGAEQVAAERQSAFYNVCGQLGAAGMAFRNSNDVHLDYHTAIKDIELFVNNIQPEIVYTHSTADIHKDHRVTAEACMVVCRPKLGSVVQELYACELPASTEWGFGQMGTFEPNVFVDITNYMELKKSVLAQYPTETYEYPDARSIQSMEVTAMNRGKQSGVKYAEAFKLIFSKR